MVAVVIAPSDVSAVLVTRGDVDLAPIIDSLAGFGEVVVWDNSCSPMPPRWWHAMPYPPPRVTWCGSHDLAVYGRFAAIESCTRDVIYVQDDDVILALDSLRDLLAAYETGVLGANMPERFRHDFYADHCLVGFGAVFDRDLPELAWRKFGWEERLSPTGDEWWGSINTGEGRPVVFPDRRYFFRTCDIVFTAFTQRKLLDLPYTDREFASAPNRMWKQDSHIRERTEMLELVRRVRDQ